MEAGPRAMPESWRAPPPATTAPFARVPDCTRAQLDAAVAAAQRAFVTWGDEAADERRSLVKAFNERVLADADTLAPMITQEQGKPLAKARRVINAAWLFTHGYVTVVLA